jgi:hypothetical protein
MSSNNWGNDVRRAMEQAANGAMKDKTKEMQGVVDRVSRTHKGRAIADVKAALRRHLTLSDGELTMLATHISEGSNVKLQTGKVQF